MSKIRRVDFSPDEWLAGTRMLSAEERGLYWDCCALIYSHGRPIADDDEWLKRALAVDVRTWRRVRARLIETRKLSVVDLDGQPHLTNGRAEREIGRANGRIEHASRGGKAKAEKAAAEQDRPNFGATSAGSSGEVPAKSGPVSSEIKDLASANHQPSTTNQEEVTTTESVTTAPRSDDGDAAPKRDARGSRLPHEWRPDDELRQWTIDHIAEKRSGVSAGHELEKFRDYWRAQPGAKGRKSDWSATWRNWIRNAIKFEGKGNGSIYRQGGGQPKRRSAAANAAAFIAALGGPGDRGPAGGGG